MPNCIYLYNNKLFNSEKELDEFLINNGDILSKYGDLALQQAYVLETIEKIQKEAIKLQLLYEEAKKNAVSIDGEERLEFNPPYIGVLKFLAGLENSEHKLLTPEFKEHNYFQELIKKWKLDGFDSEEKELFGEDFITTDNVSKEELISFIEEYNKTKKFPITNNKLLNYVGQIKTKWFAQGEIGTEIHAVLQILFTKVQSGTNKGILRLELEDSILKSLILKKKYKYINESIILNIIDYAKLLKTELETKLQDSNLIFFPEFQIKGELNLEIDSKGSTVLGIIDLLVVDSKGKVHIIDFKATPKNIFNDAKLRGFWYLLGMYYKMARLYNLEFDLYKTMIAPILMNGFRKEGDNFTLDSISPRSNTILLDITNKATMFTVSKNLNEFIPELQLVNLPPQEIQELVDKFMLINFSDILTTKTYDEKLVKELLDKKGGIKYDSVGKNYFVEGSDKYFNGATEIEVFEKFKKYYIEILPTKRTEYVINTINALKQGIQQENNNVQLPSSWGINRDEGAVDSWLQDLINKYCNRNYELVENLQLASYGVILIKNKQNRQIDVLKVTTDDLYYQHKFGNNTLLTGNNIPDSALARKSNDKTMTAITGNIHLMQTMAILNGFPELTKYGYNIGQIQVINPANLQGIVAGSNEELLYNYNQLAKFTSEKTEYKNLIGNLVFASKVDLLKNLLKHILSLGDKYDRFSIFNSTLTDLDKAISLSDEELIIKQLTSILKELENNYSNSIQTTLDTYDETTNIARNLYEKTITALASLKGFSFRLLFKDNSNIIEKGKPWVNGVQSLMMDNPGNLNNETLNYLTKIVTEAYLNVREDVQRSMSDIRPMITKLKNSKRFSKFKEMTYGNSVSLYENMIEFKNGDLLFKNPWDISSDIPTEEEREFLKYVLKIINNNRFKGEDDAEFKRLNNDVAYFRVPLAVGDFSSRMSVMENTNDCVKSLFRRLSPLKWWEDAQNKLTGVFSDDTNSKNSEELYKMNNMFELGEKNIDARLQRILEYGQEYFEHNLETLLIKHIFAYSSQKHINSIMPLAKASMIHLVSLGQLTNKKYHNATNYVTNYIKNKIKNESLTDPYFRQVEGLIGQVKQAASFLILGFNPIQYVGLIMQGFYTDIRLYLQSVGQEDAIYSYDNFQKAFKIVYKEIFKLGSKPTKLSLLNEFYGINDMDMNTYAEKISSDKYGIYNISNIAFHCASRPDYFNRMILLVCQMLHDGTWDAYSENNGILEYNWKQDKRFSAYANNKIDDPEYKKQEGLYYAMANLLIKEHALKEDGTLFKLGDPLPKAYTNQQMESIKSFLDNIYGYYTHEKKAMVHALTWGALWMQMRTYWSGKKNQYLGSGGVKLQGHFILLKNDNGELLYYKKENDRLVLTTDITGIPVMKWEGLWQEGVVLSLYNIIMLEKLFIPGKGLSWEDFWHDPKYAVAKANFIQFVYDTTMFLSIGPFIAAMMADWEDELEKEAKQSKTVKDGLVASVANLAIRSVQYGFLDFNYFESIGGTLVDWEPISFQYIKKRITDFTDVLSGDKSLSDALLRTSSITSAMKPLWKNVIE